MNEAVKNLANLSKTGTLMPVLFIGHGSPMNGIEENDYTRGWQKAVANLPKPKAIVVVSAHWETLGTKVTSNQTPPVIYDFGGFPRELYEAKYNASGDPKLAAEISENLKNKLIELDESWGLDHGTWTILRHLYPNADIPILQISLNHRQTPREHYELAKELYFLREHGVLIIGSGNMVHNLRRINFYQNGGFDWASEANETFKSLIAAGDHEKLLNFQSLGSSVALSIPTPEHYLPLLYVLGLKKETDSVEIFNDAIDLGSLSMTSVKIG